VCQNSSGKVHAETAEEEPEEGDVAEILHSTRKDVPLSEAVLQESISHVSCTWEDDSASQENFETMHVVTIDVEGQSQ